MMRVYSIAKEHDNIQLHCYSCKYMATLSWLCIIYISVNLHDLVILLLKYLVICIHCCCNNSTIYISCRETPQLVQQYWQASLAWHVTLSQERATSCVRIAKHQTAAGIHYNIIHTICEPVACIQHTTDELHSYHILRSIRIITSMCHRWATLIPYIAIYIRIIAGM